MFRIKIKYFRESNIKYEKYGLLQLYRILNLNGSFDINEFLQIKREVLITPMEKQIVHRYKSYDHLFKVCLNICLTSFTFGFGNANFNAIAFDDIVNIYHLQQYPRTTTQGLLTGCLSIMGGIGAFCSSYLLKRLTRRQSVLFLAWMSLCAGIILIIPRLQFLIIGRLMQGLCIGMCSTVAPLYLRQFSPLQIASSLCPYNQIFIVIGITSSFTLSFLFSLFLPAQIYWRLVFGFPILISCVQIYNLKYNYAYQTPKYLIENDRFEQAQQLLSIIYEQRYVKEVQGQLRQAAAKSDGRQIFSSCNQISSSQVDETNRKNSRTELQIQLVGKDEKQAITVQQYSANNKLAVFLSFHLSIQQQMVGMGSIIAYSGQIVGSFMPSMQKPFPIFINIIAVMGCFGAIPVVRYLGRKKNLQYGALSISIALGMLSYILSGYDFSDPTSNSTTSSYIVMALFISIRVLFSLSTGPIVFLYLSEIVQPNIMAIATMVNWFTVATLNIMFPILTQIAGGNPAPVYLLFAIYTFIGFLINNRYLIETAGKTEYQIRHQFDQKCR